MNKTTVFVTHARFKALLVCASIALVSSLHATMTLNLYIGGLSNASGSAVADNTLWALVSSTDATFTGFGLNDVLASGDNPDLYFTANTTSLSIGGTINGDTIFAMGGTNGDLVDYPMVVNYNVNGVVQNRYFALYWFPGVTYNGATTGSGPVFDFTTVSHTQVIGSQVGGIHGDSEGIMQFGADASNNFYGQFSSTPGAYQAVQLSAIPEPTVSLLGLLTGGLLLMRRRRVA